MQKLMTELSPTASPKLSVHTPTAIDVYKRQAFTTTDWQSC